MSDQNEKRRLAAPLVDHLENTTYILVCQVYIWLILDKK